MIRAGMTIRAAAEKWVREFNAIDQGMIEKLMSLEPDKWHEVTKPAVGQAVYVYDLPEGCDRYVEHSGEITGYDADEDIYIVELGDETEIRVKENEMDVEYDDSLPIWGRMWSFNDSCDNRWMERDGVGIMSRCGFRVYESDDYGFFFGIDGAGYSFYEEHWIPLYRARGLQWHDPATEKEAS